MSKLSIILGPLMGGSGKEYCPDCGCDMNSNGTCPDCGYGEEEGGDEEEGEESGESSHMQAMIDIRDELQRVVEKLGRLIANGD
jgi:hypothetical protein